MKMLKFKEFVDEFLVESNSLIEGSKLMDIIRPDFDKRGYDGKIESGRRDKHLRYMLGSDVTSAEKSIKSIIDNYFTNYQLEVIAPNDFKNGSYSGKYYTFKVILEDDVKIKGKEFHKGTEIVIVNDELPKGSIAAKTLTPTGFKLDDSYRDKDTLFKEMNNRIDTKFSKDPIIGNALKDLLSDAYTFQSKYKFAAPNDIFSLEETILLSQKTVDSIKHFDISDLNTVGKDFGEILGGIYLMGVTQYEKGVSFPSGNNPLVDFYIDGYGVSSKYKSGAAPTLTGIIKNLKEDQLTSDIQKRLFKIFDIVNTNKVSSGYLEIAKYLNLPGYLELEKIINKKNLTAEDINAEVEKFRGDNKGFMSKFESFYRTIGRYPKDGEIIWEKLKKGYGAILGPLSYHVTDNLNRDEQYVDALKELLSKLDVKQLYLDFYIKKNEMFLHLKSFSNEKVNFSFEAPNQSVYNADNGKLGFKMK